MARDIDPQHLHETLRVNQRHGYDLLVCQNEALKVLSVKRDVRVVLRYLILVEDSMSVVPVALASAEVEDGAWVLSPVPHADPRAALLWEPKNGSFKPLPPDFLVPPEGVLVTHAATGMTVVVSGGDQAPNETAQ